MFTKLPFLTQLAEVHANPSSAFSTKLQASNVKAYEVKHTKKCDWVDHRREQGGLFGVVSHDTMKATYSKDPVTGELAELDTYKINVAMDKAATQISTFNAQTLPVSLADLQVLDANGDRVPLLHNLEPAAAALAASYMQSSAGQNLARSLGYNAAYNQVVQEGLKNLQSEFAKQGKVDLYADCNVAVMAKEDDGTDIISEYVIKRDYNHGRITLACVDAHESTTWGVVNTAKDGTIGSFHYERGPDGRVQGRMHQFQAQRTSTEFSVGAMCDVDEEKNTNQAKIQSNMLRGMQWSGVVGIAVAAFEKRRSPEDDMPVTRGGGFRGGATRSFRGGATKALRGGDEGAPPAPQAGVYATNVVQGPVARDSVEELVVHPRDLVLVGMTVTLKQDVMMVPEEGAVFGKDEFEAQLGTAIATLAEMKTMMAEVVSGGAVQGFKSVHDAETAITADMLAQGLVSQLHMEALQEANAANRAKLMLAKKPVV